jgi:hypothetical protein
MRSLFFSALLASFIVAAACTSSTATGPGGASCPGTAPQVTCEGCCGGTFTAAAVCTDAGAWACAPSGATCGGCAAEDGGACTGTPPLTCAGCCGALYPANVCASGEWTCAGLTGSCESCDAGTDAEAADASGDGAADASGDAGSGDGSADASGDGAADASGE